MKTLMLLCSGMLLITACGSSDDDDASETNNTDNANIATDSENDTAGAPPFGSDDDVAMADALWLEIENHSNWARLGGATGFVAGGAPHGAFIRIYANGVAEADADLLPNGSILVKENFGSESEDALGALTVMKRVEGFDPDEGDWFYAKFLPDGNLDKNPAGVALAGTVGKGGDMGCIPCHAGAGGGDYVFEN